MNDQPGSLEDSDSENLQRLYRLQVRELEAFAMFLTTPEGLITSWNCGVRETFGYSEEEWVGHHVRLVFTEEDRAAGIPEQEMEAVVQQGRCNHTRWHRRKDGTRVYMTGVLRALCDENGTLIGYSKVFMDDTAREQLEDALTRSNKELQQFAFAASHDLQEPIHTSQASPESCARDTEANWALKPTECWSSS